MGGLTFLSTIAILDKSQRGDSSSGTLSRTDGERVARICEPDSRAEFQLTENSVTREYRENSQGVSLDPGQILEVENLKLEPGDYLGLPNPNLNEYGFVGLAPLEQSKNLLSMHGAVDPCASGRPETPTVLAFVVLLGGVDTHF